MTKWMYRVERVETHYAPQILNDNGAQGWELVGFNFSTVGYTEMGTFIFKRPIENLLD